MRMPAAEYWKNVDWLRQVWPDWVLLPVLLEKHSYPNCIYLAFGLRQKAHEMDAPRVAEKQLLRSHSPERIKIYYLQKRKLYGERAKLSNRFHTCESDAQRAAVSEEIESVQVEIEKVQKIIRTWQEKGKVPIAVKSENEELRLLKLQIIEERNSRRAMQRQLRIEINNPPSPERDKKIARYERKLTEKNLKLSRLQAEYDAGMGKG